MTTPRIPPFRIIGFSATRLPMRTRFPFRYGIASLTDLPHLVLHVRLETGRGECMGCAAEGLPPKWFTKNPDTTFENDDLPGMLGSVSAAVRHALDAGSAGRPHPTFFAFWIELRERQAGWGRRREIPPLLAQFGSSLVERAVLDGLCRGAETTLFRAVREGALGIDLGRIHPGLEEASSSALLPAAPRARLTVRHTVGLGDPLDAEDAASDEELSAIDDGLPLTLEQNIRAYGLRWFKIKLAGNLDRDRSRLRRISRLLALAGPPDWRVTFDGNEQYSDAVEFWDAWRSLAADPVIRPLLDRAAVIEQPIHRDRALDPDAGPVTRGAPADHPPLIIDESDGDFTSLPRALDLGYEGASHKNCKGIVKGIANACLLARRRQDGAARSIMTAEDLANVGPVALLQDLAVVALLGISHAERNGHHYFRGLSMWPPRVRNAALEAHPDLYRLADRPDVEAVRKPVITLDIREGSVSLDSVNRAPFGCAPMLPLDAAEPWPEALSPPDGTLDTG